jgi:hypothetical protein
VLINEQLKTTTVFNMKKIIALWVPWLGWLEHKEFLRKLS